MGWAPKAFDRGHFGMIILGRRCEAWKRISCRAGIFGGPETQWATEVKEPTEFYWVEQTSVTRLRPACMQIRVWVVF